MRQSQSEISLRLNEDQYIYCCHFESSLGAEGVGVGSLQVVQLCYLGDRPAHRREAVILCVDWLRLIAVLAIRNWWQLVANLLLMCLRVIAVIHLFGDKFPVSKRGWLKTSAHCCILETFVSKCGWKERRVLTFFNVNLCLFSFISFFWAPWKAASLNCKRHNAWDCL